ncbi:MAG: hypothetical protein DRN92_04510 [Thermoproteota archaeon]|nr:MAG: hypothetical protein DRN92_04510 [Candidatus Korarchaeota archaeon]
MLHLQAEFLSKKWGALQTLSVLARECLNQRIGDINTLARYVFLWEEERNSKLVKVDWRFTTQDAWIKLKCLYPILKKS